MIEEMPTSPPPGSTGPGRWESYEVYAPDGSLESRTYTWVPDPLPTAPEKHRRTARDIEIQLRTRIGEYDALVTALDTAGSLTVAQLKTRTVEIHKKQGQVMRLQARIDRLLLDALDGRETETPAP